MKKIIEKKAFVNRTDLSSLDDILGSVVEIKEYAFQNCTELKEIIVPKSVKIIGQGVFAGCTNLTSITFLNPYTKIGMYAFAGCTKLRSVKLPEKIKKVENSTFRDCKRLQSIIIPDTVAEIGESSFSGCVHLLSINLKNVLVVEKSAFSGCGNLHSIVFDSVERVGEYAFYNCVSIKTITVPKSVTAIGQGSFAQCAKLTSVTFLNPSTKIGISAFLKCEELSLMELPHLIEKIDESTFGECTSLQGITIPSSVAEIGQYSFLGCSNLIHVEISKLTKIGQGVFKDCTKLRDITIPDSVQKIGKSAFHNCVSFKHITIPDSVTEIGEFAFDGCAKIENITIPNSITKIKWGTFRKCANLKTVVIPSSITEIENDAFDGCVNIENIIIPDSVTEIGEFAFDGCAKIENITIPNSITKIKRGTFHKCANLKTVTTPSSITEIGNDAFRECVSLENITIPDSVIKIGDGSFFGCSSLSSISFPATSKSRDEESSPSQHFPRKAEREIGNWAFRQCTKLSNIEIPDSVTKIGEWAFANCRELESIKLSANVTEIKENTFYSCETLKKIDIPKSVLKIGNGAFLDCHGLETVEIPDSVYEIGENAFANCVSLKNIKIPDGVDRIKYYTFQGCKSLTHVTLSSKKTDVIIEGAFYNCINLKSIDNLNFVNKISKLAFYNCAGLTFVNISSVESIGESAFSGCASLVSIDIPTQIKKIEKETFFGCTSLKNINLDSVERINDRAFYFCINLPYDSISLSEDKRGVDVVKYCKGTDENKLDYIDTIKMAREDPESWSKLNPLSIQACLEKNEETIIKNLVHAAIAQTMARNMSHNIGSHVFSKLIGENIYNDLAHKITGNYKPKIEGENYKQLAYFNQYIKNRMDYLSEVTFGVPNLLTSRKIYRDVFLEFDRVRLLLNHISGISDFEYGFELKYNDKLLSEDDDIHVAFPSDVLGCQAFYNIIENIIRNTAKHSKRNGDKVTFTIHIKDIKDTDVSKDLQEDFRQYYAVEISDCIPTERIDELVGKQNELLNNSVLNKEGQNLRRQALGLLEMEASATFLRQIELHEIESDNYHVQTDEKLSNNKHLNIIKAFKAGKNKNTLGYRFFIKKPQEFLLVGNWNVTKEVEQKLMLLGVWLRQEKEMKDDLGRGMAFAHRFVVSEKAEDEFLDDVESKWRYKTLLPYKWVFAKDEDFTKINSILSSSSFEIFKLEEKIWEIWNKQNSIDISSCSIHTRCPDSLEGNRIYLLNHFNEDRHRGQIEKYKKLVPSEKAWIEPVSSNAKNKLPYFFGGELNDYKFAIEDNNFKGRKIGTTVKSLLWDCYSHTVLVVDERVQKYSKQMRTANPEISNEEVFLKSGVIMPQCDLSADNLNENLISEIDKKIKESKPVFLLIHYGILERYFKSNKAEIDGCLENWVKKEVKVIVTSGRGKHSLQLQETICYLPLSSVSYAFVENQNKYSINYILNQARR